MLRKMKTDEQSTPLNEMLICSICLTTDTKFTHGEKFRGILVYFAGRILDKTKGGFELMNESLKVECEKDKYSN